MPKSRGKTRVAKIPPEALEALADQRRAFREKFGRDPLPGEPLFFDPDADVPTEISSVRLNAEMLEAMRKAGTPPQFVYAYKKTGLLGLGDMSTWPANRRKEWTDAVEEYFALEKAQAGQAGKSRPDPRQWSTEIAELQASPITREDHERVMECLDVMAPIQSREPTMSAAARMELAAALMADACSSAYRSAEAQGKPEEGPARFALFENLVVRRARELYAQGRA